jgi:haloalkane dehalogenase
MNDPILGRALPSMKRNFPEAPVTETKGGHFLQEEYPIEIAAALLRVTDQIQSTAVSKY